MFIRSVPNRYTIQLIRNFLLSWAYQGYNAEQLTKEGEIDMSSAPKPTREIAGFDRFMGSGLVGEYTVLDFWCYGFSRLNSSMLRGVVAEFLVETALRPGAKISPRDPWGNFDVKYRDMKIEVKCCGNFQDYVGHDRQQKNPSPILFSGLMQKFSTHSKHEPGTAEYKADIYILAALDRFPRRYIPGFGE
jgi:hypothetical protein